MPSQALASSGYLQGAAAPSNTGRGRVYTIRNSEWSQLNMSCGASSSDDDGENLKTSDFSCDNQIRLHSFTDP